MSASAPALRIVSSPSHPRFTRPCAHLTLHAPPHFYSKGKLKHGDIIFAINDESVVGEPHHEVVPPAHRTFDAFLFAAQLFTRIFFSRFALLTLFSLVRLL